mgnify:CR=1 FL=1
MEIRGYWPCIPKRRVLYFVVQGHLGSLDCIDQKVALLEIKCLSKVCSLICASLHVARSWWASAWHSMIWFLPLLLCRKRKEKELLIKNKIDLKKVSRLLIQNFLRQAVGDGFFHGDMHQGNLFVDKDENIVPVDFGIMGRLDLANRKYLAEILYGFINRDYEKVAKVHFIAGLVPNTESIDNFTQALRTIGEPIFGQSAKNISAGKLLARLFEVTEKFNMTTQPQLLLLQKTMVVVEGVARSLDEDANIWEISKPVLQGWLNNEIGPKNRIDKKTDTSDWMYPFLNESIIAYLIIPTLKR